jgi:hypothetical protein
MRFIPKKDLLTEDRRVNETMTQDEYSDFIRAGRPQHGPDGHPWPTPAEHLGVPHRPPVSEALQYLRDELESGHHQLSELTAHDAWSAFLRFGRRRFDAATTPDSDGLLFQYGTYAFSGPLMFTLNLTRQFEIHDAEGEHDHYAQIHCEVRYVPHSSLHTLGAFNTWFFHDTGGDLDAWVGSLNGHLKLLQERRPSEIGLYEEQV